MIISALRSSSSRTSSFAGATVLVCVPPRILHVRVLPEGFIDDVLSFVRGAGVGTSSAPNMFVSGAVPLRLGDELVAVDGRERSGGTRYPSLTNGRRARMMGLSEGAGGCYAYRGGGEAS